MIVASSSISGGGDELVTRFMLCGAVVGSFFYFDSSVDIFRSATLCGWAIFMYTHVGRLEVA